MCQSEREPRRAHTALCTVLNTDQTNKTMNTILLLFLFAATCLECICSARGAFEELSNLRTPLLPEHSSGERSADTSYNTATWDGPDVSGAGIDIPETSIASGPLSSSVGTRPSSRSRPRSGSRPNYVQEPPRRLYEPIDRKTYNPAEPEHTQARPWHRGIPFSTDVVKHPTKEGYTHPKVYGEDGHQLALLTPIFNAVRFCTLLPLDGADPRSSSNDK